MNSRLINMLNAIFCNLAQNFERSEKPSRLPQPISVYATLIQTKVQAFYQYRLSLFATLRPSLRSGRQLALSGLSLRGFSVAPQKYATLHWQSLFQKAHEGNCSRKYFYGSIERCTISTSHPHYLNKKEQLQKLQICSN